MNNVRKIRSGISAYQNKIGIHALTPEQTKQNAIKAKESFMKKWQDPEFREVHRNKIRLGKLSKRLKKVGEKIVKPVLTNAFGAFTRHESL